MNSGSSGGIFKYVRYTNFLKVPAGSAIIKTRWGIIFIWQKLIISISKILIWWKSLLNFIPGCVPIDIAIFINPVLR